MTPPQPDQEEAPAITAETTHVLLIDAIEPSYTVYYKIPIQNKDKIKSEGKDPNLFKIIPWEHYIASRSSAERYTKLYIKTDDYSEVDTILGLTELLEAYPETPFGLTWSGGIAYTYKDYQHVKRTYAAYLADPASHKKPERSADPVHPLNHIGPMLKR